jgi:hypothetical protein
VVGIVVWLRRVSALKMVDMDIATFGPIELQHQTGDAWRPARHPQKLVLARFLVISFGLNAAELHRKAGTTREASSRHHCDVPPSPRTKFVDRVPVGRQRCQYLSRNPYSCQLGGYATMMGLMPKCHPKVSALGVLS